jgi:hypothetical protein
MDEAAFSRKLSVDDTTEEKNIVVAPRHEEQEQQQQSDHVAAGLKVVIDGKEFDGVAVEFEESDDDEYDEEFMEVDRDGEEADGVAVEFEESEDELGGGRVREGVHGAPDLKASEGEAERHVTCTAPTA